MAHTAFIAIGSNLGNRYTWCKRALAQLAEPTTIVVIQHSRFSEYPALTLSPNDVQPPYLNGVAMVHTTLSPGLLLAHCQAIEIALGRRRPVQRWAPRIIDLDLLAYDGLVLTTPHLTIPHPELHKRRFVLEPLAEVAPAWVHPGCGQTVTQLLEGVCSSS